MLTTLECYIHIYINFMPRVVVLVFSSTWTPCRPSSTYKIYKLTSESAPLPQTIRSAERLVWNVSAGDSSYFAPAQHIAVFLEWKLTILSAESLVCTARTTTDNNSNDSSKGFLRRILGLAYVPSCEKPAFDGITLPSSL
ncbi:hypothetical protein QR680_015337 [Steinernema hermaphroditum]|uniref:Uncharacterized protein n=1 Tax=Steinernema hermaphroditum TaxID=289476 RepID=A0AA39LKN8_9BILA|nr:hypothetical protein QR680_015337 [Steinernema hermaphroditum]